MSEYFYLDETHTRLYIKPNSFSLLSLGVPRQLFVSLDDSRFSLRTTSTAISFHLGAALNTHQELLNLVWIGSVDQR
jgi:hypothetical protein